MQSQKEAILQRGEFRSYTEFYFALTDVFLAAASNREPDIRWKRVFEKERNWKLSEILQSEFHSYSDFALGLLKIGSNKVEAQNLIIAAATERVNNFERIFRLNFEGVQLPRLVDKIIISMGLAAAVKVGDRESLNLMLRGGEVLRRNLRHHLIDLGSILASQHNLKWRRNIHSYVHLVDKKHDWELERICRLLARDPASEG